MFRAGLVVLATAGLGLTATAAERDLHVSDAWIRSIVPSRPAAGYFKLMNRGDQEVELTGASSPACGGMMLHHSMRENGVDKMMMVKSVPVPAHGSIAFAPGGYHLMCTQPTSAIKPGDSVPVTLTFSNGASVTAGFAVKGATGR